jgi:hypothetical protein
MANIQPYASIAKHSQIPVTPGVNAARIEVSTIAPVMVADGVKSASVNLSPAASRGPASRCAL